MAISLDSTRGSNRELTAVQIRIGDPRARFSRALSRSQLFSSLGELFWYWSGSDKLNHIEYYISKYKEESNDKITVPGAYGPRLFSFRGVNQIDEVVTLLQKRPSTRRAVIQLYDASDISGISSPPCTCTLQFLIRKDRLNLIVSMRSNDVLMGLPHDVFAFTMIQEILARKLGIEIGEYTHFVGSLHLYAADIRKATRYLEEGFQERIPMPAMPDGDPFPAMDTVLAYESEIRASGAIPDLPESLSSYWLDIAKLLAIYGCYKKKSRDKLEELKKSMQTQVYEQAITKRANEVPWAKAVQTSLDI